MNKISLKKAIAGVCIAAVLGVGAGCIYSEIQSGTQNPQVKTESTQRKAANAELSGARNTYVVQAAKKSGSAVVGITTKVYQQDMFNRAVFVGEGVGSGVLIDKEGHIVTNAHVVADATTVSVSLSNGETVNGTVIGKDTSTDLAVVQINAPPDIEPITIGDSDTLQVGEPAIAIGNPLGLEFKGSVTSGVISALARTVDESGQRFPLIQTDAAINPGNSGGALLNADGDLIGINSSKIAQEGVEGMGFSIPINEAKPIIESIIKNGYVIRPYLGVWAIDKETAAQNNLAFSGNGLAIVQLDSDGPAANAGLRRGDIITSINGKDVTTSMELRQVMDTLKPGDTVTITAKRNGQTFTKDVTLAQTSK